MNTCFDNIVSLREYCTATTPTSDIYLNDIGLNQSTIKDIITDDYDNVRSIVEKTIAMSIKEITTEITGFFDKGIKTHTAIETGIVGVPPDASYETITWGGYRGIKLSLYNSANYLNFQLAAVSLFVDVTQSINILVYDLDQNKLLQTIPINAIAGEIVEVYPASIYRSGMKPLNLWIGYLTTGIGSYKTTTRPNQCCGNYGRNTEYLKANGTTTTTVFTSANLTNIDNTAGVGIRYSIWCDAFSWLCTYSRLIALPVAYKTASEIYRRGLMVSPNTRTNTSTTINADLMQSNFEWHETKYRESMDRLLKNIHLPKSSVCFACNSPVVHKITLP